jgi:hypothetical protein
MGVSLILRLNNYLSKHSMSQLASTVQRMISLMKERYGYWMVFIFQGVYFRSRERCIGSVWFYFYKFGPILLAAGLISGLSVGC